MQIFFYKSRHILHILHISATEIQLLASRFGFRRIWEIQMSVKYANDHSGKNEQSNSSATSSNQTFQLLRPNLLIRQYANHVTAASKSYKKCHINSRQYANIGTEKKKVEPTSFSKHRECKSRPKKKKMSRADTCSRLSLTR